MTSSLPLTFPGGAGGSWVKGCRQQGSEHLRLWHLGAPSVEAPGQEEDTNTDGHRLQTGAVHTRHGSKQACRPMKDSPVPGDRSLGVLSPRCPVIPAHSQRTQD